MRDVSEWSFIGYGENSTLEKIELLSPEDEYYVMKFPREFDEKRTNWEDVNEIIAAEIAKKLDLPVIEAQIAYRNGRRGCLMKNFRLQLQADYGETVATLLSSEFGEKYECLHESPIPNQERLERYMTLFQSFSLYSELKEFFVQMNLFDVLIGNQDRHAHNWQVLYRDGVPFYGPLYDNGASLGWQLPDVRLKAMMESEEKKYKYFKKTTLKLGLDNKEIPKIKSNTVLDFLKTHYVNECSLFLERLKNFPVSDMESYIHNFPLLTEVRKQFLIQTIYYRMEKIKQKLT
ncbi:HipA domain-containing protein [Halobacillus salinus]|uniref:HipA domain-containing protein n=1 Tax=Halobacillus salinus TaxID=192814 RepID=UPI0009A8DD7C|nr:HipA domain-containing protein [Halobacillus salinus]